MNKCKTYINIYTADHSVLQSLRILICIFNLYRETQAVDSSQEVSRSAIIETVDNEYGVIKAFFKSLSRWLQSFKFNVYFSLFCLLAHLIWVG